MYKYAIYEKNRLKVYRNEQYSYDIVCLCDSLKDAQDIVLSLTEDFLYKTFCEHCQLFSIKDSIALMKINPKYGWDKYTIEERN